jgi:hypothetical protein
MARAMTIKKAFEKLATYNELAELMNESKKAIWFADVLECGIHNGENFTDFAEFRKYVRREYIKDLADKILASDEWNFNDECEIVSVTGRNNAFELALTYA